MTAHSCNGASARTLGLAVLFAILLMLGACADVPPHAGAPDLRTRAPLEGTTETTSRWPSSDWWRRYRDPQLDTLVARALSDAPSLEVARSRLADALASVEVARAAAGLNVDAQGQVVRQRLSENGLIPSEFLGFTWYNQGDLGINAEYQFDFWGKQRAAVEAAVDQAHAAMAERQAARLTLASGVVDTYLAWQGTQARLTLVEDSLSVQQALRRIEAVRVEHGIEPPDELHKADARLAGVHEQRVALRGAAREQRAALAALLGIAPAELPDLKPRALPRVQPGLPPGVGLDLVSRRPDIVAARWRVQAAGQQVEQARAAFYPDISLGAMAGLESIDLGELFNPASRVFKFGPAIHLPIFANGKLRARYGVSQAQLGAAVAQYNETVVEAARDVARSALRIEQLQARSRAHEEQMQADRAVYHSAAAREHQGLTDARPSLSARAEWLRQRDVALALHTQALSAQVALLKALGGGYRSSAQPAATASTSEPTSREQP